MPSSGISHRIKTGLFNPVFIKILKRKAERPGKNTKCFAPFCTWDSYTDFSFRCAVTTFCTVVFLLCVKCVLLLDSEGWHIDAVTDWFGGNVGNGLCIVATSVSSPCQSHTGATDIVPGCIAPSCLQAILLCSGDIEVNPGPKNGARDDGCDKDSETRDAAESVSKEIPELPPNMADRILNALDAIQQQTANIQALQSNMSQINDNLQDIKADMGEVKTKCHEIEDRCARLESENRKVIDSVAGCEERMKELTNESIKQTQSTDKLTGRINTIDKEIASLREEVDRLESFSRRDNLRLFGIPEERKENYESCARKVCDTLNSVEGFKRWTPDDIIRAHRVGTGRDGEPKPMIVKFSNWKDKMAVITDREFRDRLQKQGVRVTNDLTRNQARVVAEARKEGRVAYFKGGKMVVGPRKADSRTYAQVTASDPLSGSDNTTRESPHERTGDSRRRARGDSPPHHSDSTSDVTGNSPASHVSEAVSPREGPQTRSSKSRDRQSTLGSWATRSRAPSDPAAKSTSSRK